MTYAFVVNTNSAAMTPRVHVGDVDPWRAAAEWYARDPMTGTRVLLTALTAAMDDGGPPAVDALLRAGCDADTPPDVGLAGLLLTARVRHNLPSYHPLAVALLARKGDLSPTSVRVLTGIVAGGPA